PGMPFQVSEVSLEGHSLERGPTPVREPRRGADVLDAGGPGGVVPLVVLGVERLEPEVACRQFPRGIEVWGYEGGAQRFLAGLTLFWPPICTLRPPGACCSRCSISRNPCTCRRPDSTASTWKACSHPTMWSSDRRVGCGAGVRSSGRTPSTSRHGCHSPT